MEYVKKPMKLEMNGIVFDYVISMDQWWGLQLLYISLTQSKKIIRDRN